MFLRPALLSLTVLLASAQFARAAEQPEQAQTAQARQSSVIGEYTDAAEQLVDEALSYLAFVTASAALRRRPDSIAADWCSTFSATR